MIKSKRQCILVDNLHLVILVSGYWRFYYGYNEAYSEFSVNTIYEN